MNKENILKAERSLARRENNLLVRRAKVNAQAAEVNKISRKNAITDVIRERVNEKFAAHKKGIAKRKPIAKASKSEIGYYAIGDDQYRGFKEELVHMVKVFRTIESDARANKFKQIVIIHGGDNIEGSHRPSGLINTAKWAVDQAIDYGNTLVDQLLDMSKKFKVNFYMVTVDNHGEIREPGTGPGEAQANNLLSLIANQVTRESKGMANLTVSAKAIFYGDKIPGGFHIALAHGNLAIAKNANRFALHIKNGAVMMRAHTHHGELIQEVTYDSVTIPAIKTHVEPYEIGGGWAQHNGKTGKHFRRGQFLRLEFTKDENKTTRVSMYKLMEVI